MDAMQFHKLALAEVDAVHRLAYHLCRNGHEADDLVQETYLRALRSADGFAPGEHGIRPWLFKILHNVLHTRRDRDRRGRVVMRRLHESAPDPPPTVAGASEGKVPPGPGVRVDWDEVDERLCRAVRELPVPHRMVFLLSAVEELKYREIADVVGVPVGTVMSRLSRARAALVRQLGDLAAEQNLNSRHRRPTPANVAAIT